MHYVITICYFIYIHIVGVTVLAKLLILYFRFIPFHLPVLVSMLLMLCIIQMMNVPEALACTYEATTLVVLKHCFSQAVLLVIEPFYKPAERYLME